MNEYKKAGEMSTWVIRPQRMRVGGVKGMGSKGLQGLVRGKWGWKRERWMGKEWLILTTMSVFIMIGRDFKSMMWGRVNEKNAGGGNEEGVLMENSWYS